MTPEELFEENRGLAIHMATKYARKYPQINLHDLAQECLSALFEAAKSHNPKVPGKNFPGQFVPFGPYALRALTWTCSAHLRKIKATPKTLSLGTKMRSRSGKDKTVQTVVENEAADDELQDDIPHLRERSRMADLRNLINTLPVQERRVLTLLYIDGLDSAEVMKRLKINYMVFRNAGLGGIKKLRVHFRKSGVKVARGGLEMGTLGGTMRRLKPQSAKNPKCVKAGKIGGRASVASRKNDSI